ncbi:MAG: nuclear transport factor 2 family protein, partial [Actinobacteria bacterium]|nr:nuclear transport factor 2 family protein [Actinomycetota bacterium]
PDPTARYRASFELAAEGRWDELAELIAEDFVFHDRRGGLGSVVRGRQHALDSTRTLLEIGAVSLEVEVLATRGDRLALLRRLFRSEDGYAVELLWIHGEDEHGRNVLGVAFDPHDVVAAFDELDSLYLAGDGAPYADALRLAQFGLTAYRERDWDTMYRVYAPDIVSFDHRPAGYGEMRGADALIARHQAMVEIAPDYALLWTRILAVDTHGSLAESVAVSTSDTGAEYANPRLFITRARTPQGPITRFESFDLEQESLAWERYRALSAASEGEPGNAARHAADDNVAMDGSRRWFHAMVDGEWDTAIDLLHPDYVMEDRRPTFGTRFPNREAMVPWMRETMAIGLTGVTLDTIALRGERLALCSRAWLARDFEVTSLCLMETDEEGRAVWAALYDPDQLEEALDELEARYLAGEGAPYASWMTASSAFRRSFNQHDWAALRELYTPDVVMVDHRNAGLGTLSGVDAVIDYHRAMADITPTHRLVLRRIPRIGPQLIVIEAVTRGDGAEGGAGTHELVRWMAMALDERGRVRRTEQFTDEAAASARFDELLAE